MSDLAIRDSVAFPAWAEFTPVGLVISGNHTIDEYEGTAIMLERMDNASPWAKADLLDRAIELFGEDAWQIVPPDQVELYRKAYWLKQIFPMSRRRERLKFSHHEAVAKMDEPDQEMWLNRAEDEQMSVSDLRKAIKGENGDERVSWAEKYEFLADTVRTYLAGGIDRDVLKEALDK